MGHAGAAGAVFPALGDADARHACDRRLCLDPPAGDKAWPARGAAEEVAWLLGAPFLVQVVEGSADTIVGVVTGTNDSAAEGRALLDRCWRGTVARPADV